MTRTVKLWLGFFQQWILANGICLFRFFFLFSFFFFQAEDGIRDLTVTGVQTCALPIFDRPHPARGSREVEQRQGVRRGRRRGRSRRRPGPRDLPRDDPAPVLPRRRAADEDARDHEQRPHGRDGSRVGQRPAHLRGPLQQRPPADVPRSKSNNGKVYDAVAVAGARAVVQVHEIYRETTQRQFYRGDAPPTKTPGITNNGLTVETGPESDNGPLIYGDHFNSGRQRMSHDLGRTTARCTTRSPSRALAPSSRSTRSTARRPSASSTAATRRRRRRPGSRTTASRSRRVPSRTTARSSTGTTSTAAASGCPTSWTATRSTTSPATSSTAGGDTKRPAISPCPRPAAPTR